MSELTPEQREAFERIAEAQEQARSLAGLGGSGPLSVEEMRTAQETAAAQVTRDVLGAWDGTHEGTEWGRAWHRGGMTHKRELPEFAFRTVMRGCWEPQTARDLVLTAWTHPEWPAQIGAAAWRLLFWQIGPLPVVHEDAEPLPDEPVQMWRGAYEEHRAGLSWTTDRDVAAWFAQRATWPDVPGRQGQVWTATVHPGQVLAVIGGARGESEVVCDIDEAQVSEDPDSG